MNNMAMFRDNLQTLIGRVQDYKPNASAVQCRKWINDAIEDLSKSRSYWSDMIRTVTVGFPDPYTTGTVSVSTSAGNIVAGSVTGWPVFDAINSTIPSGISRAGFVDFRIASVDAPKATQDSILYVDGGTPSAEAVPVVYKNGDVLTGKFAFPHNPGVTATQSSLAGQQLLLGSSYPVFTVMAVHSATELELDAPWGEFAKIGMSYQIVKMYSSIAPRCRQVMDALDTQQGFRLETDHSRAEVDAIDPGRNSPGSPVWVVDYGPNVNGNMAWEVWFAPGTNRQIAFVIAQGWPELLTNDDRPPHFLDPAMIAKGAAATALRTKIVTRDGKDEYYDRQQASELRQEFEMDKMKAINADEARSVQDYTNDFIRFGGPGANSTFALSHIDIDAGGY